MHIAHTGCSTRSRSTQTEYAYEYDRAHSPNVRFRITLLKRSFTYVVPVCRDESRSEIVPFRCEMVILKILERIQHWNTSSVVGLIFMLSTITFNLHYSLIVRQELTGAATQRYLFIRRTDGGSW